MIIKEFYRLISGAVMSAIGAIRVVIASKLSAFTVGIAFDLMAYRLALGYSARLGIKIAGAGPIVFFSTGRQKKAAKYYKSHFQKLTIDEVRLTNHDE